VVLPRNAEEIARVLKLAHSEQIPLTPRGLGTGLAGGSIPLYGGILLSLELMNNIIEIDYRNLMVRTQPGINTGRLQKTCLENRLYYPVDPASLDDCSIGGNVATNAGGARAFKYGVTGDYVTGIQAVLADGSIINYGGKLRKNATGYDLNKIIIGSEGTLAVITEITLRLVPKPRYQIDLLIPFPALENGVELVLQLVQDKRILPAVIEFMEQKGTTVCAQAGGENLPLPDAAVQILVELEGNDRNAVLEDAFQLGEMATRLGAWEPLIAEDEATQSRLWAFRRSIAKTLKKIYPEVVAEDIVVPLSQLPLTVEFINRLGKELNLLIIPFGHIGDGNIHTDFCRTDEDQSEWRKRIEVAIDRLIDFVVQVGGQISAEHGIGALKKHLLKKGLTPAEINLMRKLKKALDPENILNPGKILP